MHSQEREGHITKGRSKGLCGCGYSSEVTKPDLLCREKEEDRVLGCLLPVSRLRDSEALEPEGKLALPFQLKIATEKVTKTQSK